MSSSQARKDAVMMVEGTIGILPEETVAAGDPTGARVVPADHRVAERSLSALAGKPRWEFTPPAKDTAATDAVRGFLGTRLRDAIYQADKTQRQARDPRLAR